MSSHCFPAFLFLECCRCVGILDPRICLLLSNSITSSSESKRYFHIFRFFDLVSISIISKYNDSLVYVLMIINHARTESHHYYWIHTSLLLWIAVASLSKLSVLERINDLSVNKKTLTDDVQDYQNR